MNKVIIAFDGYSVDNVENKEMGLKYWWTISVEHAGNHTKIYSRYVFAGWKAMLWYIKGERINDLIISNTISDLIKSTASSKLLHNREQSPVETEHIIKKLSLEHQTILEPMMGTGTNDIAALKWNRKITGIKKRSYYF